MEALDLLLSRSSNAKLIEPAPGGEVLENILKAALRAPDHANLSPFSFIVCQGEGLQRLADIYHDAAIKSEMDEATVEKTKTMTFRAPMIIVAIAKTQVHKKVPEIEQVATTACAVQNMQMAAQAQGFNGMWRTGSFAYDPHVKQAFDLNDNDHIVGYLYLGTPASDTVIKKQKLPENFVKHWD